MIELRKATMRELKKYHDKVYFHQAPKDVTYPYVVQSFPNSFVNGDQEIFNMDIDVYDDKDDTTEIETIASNIWRAFKRFHYIDENIQFTIFWMNRLPPLNEDEKHLKVRKLIFGVRYFDRRI